MGICNLSKLKKKKANKKPDVLLVALGQNLSCINYPKIISGVSGSLCQYILSIVSEFHWALLQISAQVLLNSCFT